MSIEMLLYRVVLVTISREGVSGSSGFEEHYRRVSCWCDGDCRYLSKVDNSLSVDMFVRF